MLDQFIADVEASGADQKLYTQAELDAAVAEAVALAEGYKDQHHRDSQELRRLASEKDMWREKFKQSGPRKDAAVSRAIEKERIRLAQLLWEKVALIPEDDQLSARALVILVLDEIYPLA